MNVRISRLILTLVIILLLPMTLVTYVPSVSVSTRITFGSPPVPGADSFVEDFTSTTYEDGVTAADGWGTGTVTCARDYSVTQLDFFSTTNPVYAVDVQGRNAYLTCYNPSSGADTIYILNIGDPSNIRSIGSRTSSQDLVSGKVHGDIYYAGRQYGSNPAINVYNVSNPYDIDGSVYLGNILLDGAVSDIEVQGHFLYVADYGSTSNRAFVVVDVQDPSNEKMIPNDWITTTTLGLEIHGQIAYLAHGIHGLYMLDISNPYDIDGASEIGHLNTFGNATDVIVDGTIAYVADGPDGVQIIDVSNPVLPASLGEINTPGNARKLALQGKTLFVADESGGLRILDVSDPTNPIEVLGYATPYVWDVDLLDGDLVVATDSGVYTYRVGAAGGGLTTLPVMGSFSGYEVRDVCVRGDIAYVAAGPDGFLTLDISDPTSPVLLDQDSINITFATSVSIQGIHCYVTSTMGGEGFAAFDVADPTNIQFLDDISFASDVSDAFVAGDVAYITATDDGLYLFNISNPSALGPIIEYVSEGYNYTSVWVQGNFVYITVVDPIGATEGLYIYNALDPSNLVLTDTFSQSLATDIEVDGDYCAISDGVYGPRIFNVTDPTNIIFLDYYVHVGANYSYGVALFGNYLLSASGPGGLYLIDTTNPTNFQFIALYDATPMLAFRVTVHGDYAYLANRTSLMIFRLFRSAANTYEASSVAQSTAVDTTVQLIEKATLTRTATFPTGTSISFEMSADGGAHWEAVTVGVEHTFANPGSDLRWRATLLSTFDHLSPQLSQVSIDYVFNDPPTAPTLNDPGTMHTTGEASVSWSASTDADGTVDHYELQMSESNTFSAILDSWTPTGIIQLVTGLASNTYYFRVRAIDNDGGASSWSNIEDIIISLITPPPLPPLLLIAIAVIIIIVVIIVILLLLRRRSGEPT